MKKECPTWAWVVMGILAFTTILLLYGLVNEENNPDKQSDIDTCITQLNLSENKIAELSDSYLYVCDLFNIHLDAVMYRDEIIHQYDSSYLQKEYVKVNCSEWLSLKSDGLPDEQTSH